MRVNQHRLDFRFVFSLISSFFPVNYPMIYDQQRFRFQGKTQNFLIVQSIPSLIFSLLIFEQFPAIIHSFSSFYHIQ